MPSSQETPHRCLLRFPTPQRLSDKEGVLCFGLKGPQTWCVCPQPDYWCVALKGKEVRGALQNTSGFLRKRCSDVSCPPACPLTNVSGHGLLGRGKNKAEGFLSYFVNLRPEVKCAYTDAVDEQKLRCEELKWAFARGPPSLQARSLGAHLPVQWSNPVACPFASSTSSAAFEHQQLALLPGRPQKGTRAASPPHPPAGLSKQVPSERKRKRRQGSCSLTCHCLFCHLLAKQS